MRSRSWPVFGAGSTGLVDAGGLLEGDGVCELVDLLGARQATEVNTVAVSIAAIGTTRVAVPGDERKQRSQMEGTLGGAVRLGSLPVIPPRPGIPVLDKATTGALEREGRGVPANQSDGMVDL